VDELYADEACFEKFGYRAAERRRSYRIARRDYCVSCIFLTNNARIGTCDPEEKFTFVVSRLRSSSCS
jgi:hypothetical protein